MIGLDDALDRFTNRFQQPPVIEARHDQVVDVQDELQAIPFFPELEVVLLCLFPDDPVFNRDRDDRRNLLRERENVVGKRCRRSAAECEHSHPPTGCRERKPARRLQPFTAKRGQPRRQRPIVRDRNDRGRLGFPDRGRGSVLGDRLRLERQLEISGREDDEPQLILPLVVQQQGQVVERDQRMEVLAEDVNELGERPVSAKRLGQAQHRVVAREI